MHVNANSQVRLAGTDVELGATVAAHLRVTCLSTETLTKPLTAWCQDGSEKQAKQEIQTKHANQPVERATTAR